AAPATVVAVTPEDSAVLSALDRAWARIQELHPGVPGMTFEIGPGPDTSCSAVDWDQPVIRLNLLRGDRNASGAELLERLLHYSAHALFGGAMSSSEGRYHSADFRKAAEELGLVAEPLAADRPVAGTGWSHTSL